MERKVIIISGATASGKTTLSLKLAEQLQTEIISADSRQIYKLLDIGTAKPDKAELSRIKHHLIDCIEPWENYSAAQFEKDALKIIAGLHKANKIPVVVGGTGLYIRALTGGIFDTAGTDPEYREQLDILRIEKGNDFLLKMLREVDPVSAEKLLPQNYKRIIRALEVFRISGEPIWKLQSEHHRETRIEFMQFGINWERQGLYDRINRRVDAMMEAGFLEEVKQLLDMGYDLSYNSMNTVGYKELIRYLEGKYPLAEAVEAIKQASRNYAKRQMTWFRGDKEIVWFEAGGKQDLDDAVKSITEKL